MVRQEYLYLAYLINKLMRGEEQDTFPWPPDKLLCIFTKAY